MSLRFIYGRSGSGKTHYCLQEIKERLQSKPGVPLVLLVPEQYTFQAEKDLIRALGTGGILEAEVLSFRRLAFRIFQEAGGITYPHLHAAGKCMMIYKVLNNMKNQLPLFAKSAERQGFVNTISALITEFKRYHITSAELTEALDHLKDHELLKDKLTELAAVYQEYETQISRSYRDVDDDLTLAAAKMKETSLYQGAEIWIDGFAGFTPQEYQLIAELGKKAERINISLCTDSLGDNEQGNRTEVDRVDVFAAIDDCYRRLCRMAQETGLKIDEAVGLNMRPLPRFRESAELSHLEQNLFAYPHQVYPQPTRDIALFSSVNIYAEIESCAKDIIRLCRDKGLRYREIALITGDLASYERLIEVIFQEYEIPFFLDSKTDVLENPLIRLVLAMLDIFIDNWSYEAVFRYLKTGLTAADREQIDFIENYVLACGIRGNRWTKSEAWDMKPGLLPQERDNSLTEEDLEEINQIRRFITDPLLTFRHKISGKKKAAEICGAIYDFLVKTGVPSRLEEQIEIFRSSGRLNLANEYAQIWNILMDVFDQIVEVLGDEPMGIEKFAGVLKIGLGEYQVGLIPPSLDQVLVGSVHRSRSHEVKALYILGANDGVFPAAALEEGLLTDQDRVELKSLGIELASDTRSKVFDEQYLVYKALTTPGRYLRISWPLADAEGKSMRPSLMIARLRKLFPKITESSDLQRISFGSEAIEDIAGRAATFRQLASNIRFCLEKKEADSIWPDVYCWYAQQGDWQSQCQSLRAVLRYKNIASPIRADQVLSLYGNPLRSSVSRMEKYAACAFAFYLQYGLKAKERKVFRLTPPDIGTFMHSCVEKFCREVALSGIPWRELDPQWCEDKVSFLVDEMLAGMNGQGIASSKRMTVLTARLKRVITRAVWLITEHIRRSSFEPIGYEIGFGENEKLSPIVIELDSGQKVHLTGRIDRVDALPTDDGTYLRIVDYKSGSKDFKLSDLYHGLQIQLIIYLNAFQADTIEGIKAPVMPAGILYFRLDDPMIRTSGKMEEEEIKRAIMKQLKMKGLLLADINVIKAMDKEIQGSSLIIPAKLTGSGDLGKSSAATREQFQVLTKYAHKLLKEMCGEICAGNVAIRPLKAKKFMACDYCDFGAVCQFDAKLRENRYRPAMEYKEAELWQRMKEGGDDHGN